MQSPTPSYPHRTRLLGCTHLAYPWLPISQHLPPAADGPSMVLASSLSPHHPRRLLDGLTLLAARLHPTLTVLGPSSRYHADAPRHVRLSPWWPTVAYRLRHPTLTPPTDRPWVLPFRDRARALPHHPIAALYLQDTEAFTDPDAVFPWLLAYPDLPVIVSATDPCSALWLLTLARLSTLPAEARSHVLVPLRPGAPHLRWQFWVRADQYIPASFCRAAPATTLDRVVWHPIRPRTLADGPRPPREAKGPKVVDSWGLVEAPSRGASEEP